MIGLLIGLGIVVALAFLPLGLVIKYDDQGLVAWLAAGPIKYHLYPEKEEKDDSSDKLKQEVKDAVQQLTSTREKTRSMKQAMGDATEQKGGELQEFLSYLKLLWIALTDERIKLRVRRLELRIVMAGEDPCEVVWGYGGAWAVLGTLFSWLDSAMTIKKQKIDIQCDFTAEQTTVVGRLDITITLGRLLILLARYVIYNMRVSSNTRKGGA